MPILINNARVFSPAPLGPRSILVSGGKIVAVEEQIDLSGSALEIIDAGGRWLLPGFVDALTHPCGGGGEGGFGNRTGELTAAEFIQGGVTCPVGALGTVLILRNFAKLGWVSSDGRWRRQKYAFEAAISCRFRGVRNRSRASFSSRR